MNNLPWLIVLLLVLLIIFSISFSLNTLKGKKELSNNIINNVYTRNAINYALLIVLALFNILMYIFMRNYFNELISTIITLFGGNAIIGIFAVLPILSIAENKPLTILTLFKPFILLIKYGLFPLTFLYVVLRNLLYQPNKKKMTEDEFLNIIDKAEEDDSINENESQLIKSVLDFDDLKVEDILTPRTEIVAINRDSTLEKITKKFRDSGYSRLPVFNENIDNIIGIINHKDFYNKVLIEKKPLDSIIQKPIDVTEYMSINDLLTFFKTRKHHMAIVKDEYGGTLGIVTMEDILEELVGDIWDEHDKISENIKKIDDSKYVILGSTYLEDLEDIIDFEDLDDEDYSTINGWVLANLGKMGVKGDSFKYKNLDVKVLKANSKMILEVEITIHPESIGNYIIED
ncbi:hemolysin family protein [Haploplasma axanthum]|uniref:Magnesium and cobalt efflux protein CorC n=1 Tax=Haploplasma axanthum TaxID=29552 RepID=A0A449BEP3_HAPAX|nr:hemolysin family protein [Haploplasma axanthum]VEU80780.1 Magnesium and cobalt efflux protein CorC [Haploplasma axanthum]